MSIEIEMLRKIPYFSMLSTDELAQVATLTVERHFNRGNLILIAGETEGSLCYVCIKRHQPSKVNKSTV